MQQASSPTDITLTASRRLPARPGELIDRTRTVSFTFNGKDYTAYAGDTIASALAAAGVEVFSRSFKYHRPRGLMCCAGHCPNCLVQVGDEPNARACLRPVERGLAVRAQNVWPSLERDMMALTALGERFMPVGFYYKTFIHPKSLWPTYEHILRHAAGLGEVYPDTTPDRYDKQYLHADVAVVGGGPAGLSAAIAAAQSGARVLLFDDGPALGGHLRYTGNENNGLTDLMAEAENLPDLKLYTAATVLGWFEENWLAAMQGTRLYKVRAKSIVFATGAYEQPFVFDNNDLPGVMLAGAARRLLHLYGVRPGRRAVIVTANDDGWAAAAELQDAGLTLAGVVDERPGALAGQAAKLVVEGTPIFWRHTIQAAQGSRRVQGAVIAPLDENGRITGQATQRLDCDLILISVGWTPANGLLYQANAKLAYDHQRAEFLPQSMPDGIYAAGRVVGAYEIEAQRLQGRLAGLQAVAYLGLGAGPAAADWDDLARRLAAESRRTSTLVQVPGKKKRFLCFCEDVTDHDLEMAVAEGYNSIELLKRYSTISMGPCQGKMCSHNTIHLCARANGWTIEQTGTTTARPPGTPVKLGVLAGQNMEPVQVSAVHSWHKARGARMMVAGLWLRPEHYGDPAVEVQAVRERAGLIDVSTLGKLRLTGPGAPDLLDRLYVNKWQKLATGRVRYGLMCNDEGVILDDGVTAHIAENAYYATTTSSGSSSIYEWIQWWAQSGWGESVHITNITEVNAAFNLAGPQSRAILQKLTDLDLANGAFPYMSVRQARVAGVPCLLFRIGFTGELSYEIHCPAGYGLYLWQAIMAAGQDVGIMPFGVEAQRILRLEKGHIIVGQDTDAMTDPLSADMAWAVKLDKADFLGNRALSRISEDGPRQKLAGFKMARPGIVPDEGLQIVRPGPDGQLEIIGWVTSSRYSPTLNEAIGLCWLPAELASREGAAFTIRANGRLEEARVHHGPFYDPNGERLRM